MSLLVSCQNLSHAFGGRTLFENISFGINEKDKIGLIGPNGVGKSTLLKIILKRIKPDKGEIVHKTGISFGYLEQQPEFDNNKSWMENILAVTDDYAHAFEWISKLSLSEVDGDRKFSEFSGGMQKRMALARELAKNPDFLFLDEPTNHLDVDSILWLEDFLTEQNLSFLMITHDRLFLERTCTQILDLDKKNPNYLLNSKTDFATHLENKIMLFEQQKSTLEKKKNTLTRETDWLRRGAQARQTKQKARIMGHGVLADEVKDLKNKVNIKDIEFDFGEQKGPKKLVEFSHVDFSYGEQSIWKDFNYIVSSKTRLGIMGKNGSGKSTLLKLMTKQLNPDSGVIKCAENIKISYFEQSKDTIKADVSVLKNICPQGDYINFQGEFIFAKSYLERFGFSYDQMDLVADKMSGGEKSRLRLAQLMLTEAQLLLLDEPTNDLDLESLMALEQSLDSFPGGIVLVSHDRYFMDRVCNQILSIEDQNYQLFSNYFQWEAWYNEYRENLGKNNKSEVLAGNTVTTSSEKPSAKKKGLSYKEEIEFGKMEAVIQSKEAELSHLQTEINKPEVQSDSHKINEYYSNIGNLEKEIEKLYSRWSELESKKN
jgi:ATP-binding cassette subfamily F protein uup